MRRLKLQRRVKICFQFCKSLPGIGVDQIEAKAVEIGLLHRNERSLRFVGGMNAAEKLEQPGLKRLHPDADAIDAGVTVAKKFLAINGARIRFQSDFAIGLTGKRCGDRREKLTDALWFEGGWRAAAEKNALHGSAAPFVSTAEEFELAQQSISIALLWDLRHDVRVEVAVGTFADAVGNMDV